MDILGTVPRLLGEETSQPNAQLMPGGPPIELNPLVEKKIPSAVFRLGYNQDLRNQKLF